MKRRHFRGAWASLLLALTPSLAAASPASPPPEAREPGESLSVYLLTMGPGDAVWEVWGHNALWLRDEEAGLDVAYNWGMFSFEQPGFLRRLARGTMLYWMEGIWGEGMVRQYAALNRDIYLQELNLTPEQRSDLLERLRRTDTDENRFYRYDYYRDNCSTRVRDALDAVLGGRIGQALDTLPAGWTWRGHARRILRDLPLAYTGMQFALGTPADRPITAWEEGFLPLRLMEHLRSVSVVDAQGREAPLVLEERQLFRASRPPAPEAPPVWLPWFLAAGLAAGGVVVAAAVAAGRRGWSGAPGVLSDVLAATWGAVAGAAGLLLLLAWLLTDHVFWYRNENLLQASPLSLVLAGVLAAALLGRSGARRWAGPAALAVLALSIAGLALKALPAFHQVNGEIVAFVLPVHVAVAWAALRRGAGASPGGGAKG